MNKITRTVLVILTILFLISLFILKMDKKEITRVCIGQNCFEVEVAKTEEEKARGLMYRESLEQNKGMLFVYEKEGIYSFWMKNTLIPLDIIWINKDKKIVYIEKNVQPCKTEECFSYKSESPAKYVLEIGAGLCDELGIKTDNKVNL